MPVPPRLSRRKQPSSLRKSLSEPPEEEPVDASSMMLIMTLGAECGTEVTVESENEEAVAAIAELVAKDLDAE